MPKTKYAASFGSQGGIERSATASLIRPTSSSLIWRRPSRHFAALPLERLRADEHEASAEALHDHRGVAAHQALDLLEPGELAVHAFAERGFDERPDRHRMTLEEDLVLVLEVVVERGLGDVQSRGDVVEGGPVEAALVERARGDLEGDAALGLVGSALLAPRPGFFRLDSTSADILLPGK